MATWLQTDSDPYIDVEDASKVWQHLLEGDRAAIEALYKRYYDDLFHYAVKFSGEPDIAEDNIQKVFLKIWRRRDQLGNVKGVKTYLWTALRRSMIDTFRKKKMEKKYTDKISNDRVRMQFSAEEIIINKEISTIRREKLKEAIDQLSAKQREVLYLKFYDGMSYEEIEQVMSISYQTSRNYIYEALKSLRIMLSTEVMTGVLMIGFLLFL